ncbi:MAG: NAD-dependent succinate-semialdehyde dehydrogenase [Chloroflexota bacterium]|nr:MAG: NAD-dependent succinate-semialdehyde dehydrogenase [Chloroflexota bacterium]
MPDFIFKQLIDGQWVDAANGNTWDLLNPATEESLGLMPFGDAADAEAALDAAAKAFPAWSRTTPYERAEILMKAAAWVRERIDELGRISTEESGKPLRESTAEWVTAANLFEWYAEEGKRAYGRTIPARKADRRIMVVYSPVGVVGTISAWNFPVYNIVRSWAAALAAGCTVVGRPSEYTPRSAMLLAQALVEAGIPAGVINVINGDPEAMGQAMLKDPRCRKISFTGSTRVGKILLEGSAETLTKLALELGGNAPVLVFPDVDVEQVAKQAIAFKYRNCGQVCIAPQRFFVHSRIAEEFIDRVTNLSRNLKLGNGLDASTDVGPLINARQRERVEQLLAASVAQGAEVLVGGSRPEDKPRGYFYNPTVVTNLKPDMPLYREEIFGPVMPVIPFDDVDEALALANNTEYGLAAYVQTGNLNTAIRMYEELEYGMVAINDWLPSTPEAPFGGVKQSGIGRECGREGMEKYLEPKTVFIGGLP